MAFQKAQGSQLDIQDVADSIAGTPGAIQSIATGVTSDPGAEATLDLNYLRRDGTGAMTSDLDIGLNDIVNVGTVDGRSISADGGVLDTHVGNSLVHFTEGSIDHDNILNVGVNDHNQIDGHIANATTHFTEASIDHANIANVGTNTHAQIDTHLADATTHFTAASIDHTAIANIGSNTHAQIDTHLGDATVHYTMATIDHTAISNIGTNTHAQIDTHMADATTHRVINDAGTTVTDLWSADKITTELALKATGSDFYTKLESDGAAGSAGSKTDKVNGATVGNFAGLDAAGNLTDSGSAAATFATAAQGLLADTATQPADNVSTLTNDANYQGQVVPALANNFAALNASGDIIDGSSQASDFATAAQGLLADSATQPADNVSTLTNDASYTTDTTVAGNHYTKTEADATGPAAGAKIDKVAGVSGNVVEFGASNSINDTGVATNSLAPLASPVFTGVPQLPSYTLGTLPTGVIGGVIYVSDANASAGAMAFYNGSNWIDPSTGSTVA